MLMQKLDRSGTALRFVYKFFMKCIPSFCNSQHELGYPFQCHGAHWSACSQWIGSTTVYQLANEPINSSPSSCSSHTTDFYGSRTYWEPQWVFAIEEYVRSNRGGQWYFCSLFLTEVCYLLHCLCSNTLKTHRRWSRSSIWILEMMCKKNVPSTA